MTNELLCLSHLHPCGMLCVIPTLFRSQWCYDAVVVVIMYKLLSTGIIASLKGKAISDCAQG